MTNTGPAVANKALKKGLDQVSNEIDKCYFSINSSYINRIIELLYMLSKVDAICFCSSSKINIIAILLSKFFKVRLYYVMHGHLALEGKINHESPQTINSYYKYENFIFRHVNKVICVSRRLQTYMRKEFPEYAEKFLFTFNAIDLEDICKVIDYGNNKKINNKVISMGGGMKRKNNLQVCKAIEKLNANSDMKIEYVIIGPKYQDHILMQEYKFVTYYESLNHDQVLNLLKECSLYIQNSIFETFGLGILEALFAGCSILVSNNVGMLDILSCPDNNDIIFDTTSTEEIAQKIKHLLLKSNNKRLLDSLKLEVISPVYAARSMLGHIKQVKENDYD